MNLKTIDRRKLLIGLALLLVAVAAGLGLAFTARDDSTADDAAMVRIEEKKAIDNDCASGATFQGLKQLVFDQVGRLRTLERVNFDILSSGAVVRMEEPVVRSHDESLALTRCSGRFILELPPGAEAAFEGEPRLVADTVYEIQAAADGSGPVYRMTGAEAIVSRLAAFDMEGRRLSTPTPEMPEAPLDDGQILPDPGSDLAPPPIVVTRGLGAEPESATSNPSFNCRYARTRGELLVCGSDRLATQDRRMADLYASAMAYADGGTRRLLARSRDAFLTYRDRCLDTSCVAEAYEGRMREIRDIMAGAD